MSFSELTEANEQATTFTAQLLASLAPFNDPSGFWVGYNTALAAMFEQVFAIVSDQGDPDQLPVATLSAPLTTGTPITSLPIQPLGAALPPGRVTVAISVQNGPNVWVPQSQNFDTVGAASGQVLIPVETATPNFSYPAGAVVMNCYVPGWSSLLDPEECPDQFLPFLAAFAGTQNITPFTNPAVARALIQAEGGMQRGTPAAIISAAQANLSGTQSCILIERTPDAYTFVLVVRPEEVINLTALINAVTLVKPAGTLFTVVETDGWVIAQVEAAYATISALEAAFLTISGVETESVGS